MAIGRINGPMLSSNLTRNGIDLAIETSLLYVDVTNNRIGIGTNFPDNTLTVDGGPARLNDVTFNANTISTNIVNQDLLISPNGTGIVIVPSIRVTAATADRIVYTDGNKTLSTDADLSYVPGFGLTVNNGLTVDSIKISGDTITTVSGSGPINISSTGTITAANLSVNSLTTGQVLYAGPSNQVVGDPNFTFNSTTQALSVTGSFAVDDVTIDGSTISTASGLTITPAAGTGVTISDTSAIRVPMGTTTQRPSTPAPGMVRFNQTNLILEFYNGTDWVATGSDFGLITSQTFTGDDTTTAFTLANPATTNSVIVSINGVVQVPGSTYSVTGTTLNMAQAPSITDEVEVRTISSNYSITQLSDSAGTTAIDVEQSAAEQIIRFSTNGLERVIIDENGILDASSAHSIQLPSYDVISATALTNTVAGQMIYVTDGDSGLPCVAVFDGTSWKVLSLGSTIS